MSATRQPAPHRKARHTLASIAALALTLSLSLGTLVPNTASAGSRAITTGPAPLLQLTGDEAIVDLTETATEIVFADEPTVTETQTAEPTVTETPPPPATETATTTPPATETSVLATVTSTPEPATSTPDDPTVTSTPESTATATPSEGPVELEFVETAVHADQGSDARFELIVRNGDVAQTIDLATSSTSEWTIKLWQADGDITVTDSDDDGQVDVGRVNANAEQHLVITVAVPKDTLAATEDTLTVRVPGHEGVRATLTVNPMVTLTFDGSDASFGAVNMLGMIDPTISGLASFPDDEGATYIKKRAIEITVTSNTDWFLTCTIDRLPALMTQESRFSWRQSDSESWTAFGTGDERPVCARGKAGTTVVELDLSLRVELADSANLLSGTIHITWDN